MRIGGRDIGPNQPAYIIAELGVNHDGSVERALALTDAAAEAGADAIKLQFFEADRLMSRASRLAAYQQAAGETDPLEMLRRLELGWDAMERVIARAHERSLHAIVTIFSLEHVEDARRLPWDAFKTASPDVVNKPLLEALGEVGSGARTGSPPPRPLIVSTGAATLQEVARALTWLHPVRERLAVLQCVSSYPTPLSEGELGGIGAIADIWPGAIGYSDHTAEVITGAVAVTLGAQVLEKHMTYDKLAPGPDHIASLNPREFAEYVDRARQAFDAREHLRKDHPPQDLARFIGGAEKLSVGRGAEYLRTKRVLAIEEDVRRVSRQSVVATRALPTGHTIARGDVTVKRPGTGIPAESLLSIVGTRLVQPAEADMPLLPEHFEPRPHTVGTGGQSGGGGPR